jgi:hypothetical protein
MLLSDIILQSSEAALQLQLNDGSFPPGCNGPYHDPETSVRNTAHWLITMLKAYEISNDLRFKDSAWQAVQYLLLPSARPMNATFYCRKNPEKDLCNGLIGQAWTIEALAIAGIKFGESRHIDLAGKIFMLHPFDYKTGLWRRVNVDGSYNSYDMAFNHQLWFAASGSLLNNFSDNPIEAMIIRFLDCVLESHLSIDNSGRIIHEIMKPAPTLSRSRKIYNYLRGSFRQHNKSDIRESDWMTTKEIGYHAFNMYAFSILKLHMPEHPLWQSNKFLSTLEYMNKEEFINGLENNIYGYSYNLSGFEAAFAIQEFRSLVSFSKSAEWWVEQQLRRCYSMEERMMNRSGEDKLTLAARLYEVTRLKDMEISAY